MKFIDWFAGIGGFRRGMELAGHECVGFCEFDNFEKAKFVNSDSQLYKQAGNGVTVNVIEAIAEKIREEIGQDV